MKTHGCSFSEVWFENSSEPCSHGFYSSIFRHCSALTGKIILFLMPEKQPIQLKFFFLPIQTKKFFIVYLWCEGIMVTWSFFWWSFSQVLWCFCWFCDDFRYGRQWGPEKVRARVQNGETQRQTDLSRCTLRGDAQMLGQEPREQAHLLFSLLLLRWLLCGHGKQLQGRWQSVIMLHYEKLCAATLEKIGTDSQPFATLTGRAVMCRCLAGT